MAEVATGVLHNVGNVLNSINVSATLVAERLRKSKVQELSRAVEVMDQQAVDSTSSASKEEKERQFHEFPAPCDAAFGP